ncbi:MAG: hypothetical protein NT062_26145, partial [Proteobacteria bacterium]|nr:hypothetical protein [Pseudomonadota bacterium]
LAAVAVPMTKMIEDEMRGTEIFALGSFEKVTKVVLEWAQLAQRPGDAGLVPAGTDGYVRMSARVTFAHVEIPLIVALVPAIVAGQLKFTLATRAELDFDNRVIQWASDKIGANKLATKLTQRELDASLITTLAPPPPFDLTDKQRLEFTYCDQPPEIRDHAYAALPFAVTIGRVEGAPTVLPIKLGPAPHAAVPAHTMVALDLDLDALNALLYELWRSGFLDRRLAEVGLDRAFNTDPTVTEYLSIRMSPVRLALPPVLTAEPRGLALAADGRVAISDGATTTVGRVWGGLALAFVTGADARTLGTSVELRALELSCERTPTTLVPCYADLVGAIRDRGGEFHGVLTTAFAKLVTDIFVEQRIAATGMPVDLVIRGVTPSLALAAPNASMRLTFDASLSPPK